jgi:phosphohistidine phosphatase
MGKLLKNQHLVPEAVVSSTAIRARATAELVAKASEYKGEGRGGEITLNNSLYSAGPQAYLDVLHHLSDEYVRVMIVGHNLGLEDLVEMLTQTDGHTKLARDRL